MRKATRTKKSARHRSGQGRTQLVRHVLDEGLQADRVDVDQVCRPVEDEVEQLIATKRENERMKENERATKTQTHSPDHANLVRTHLFEQQSQRLDGDGLDVRGRIV